MLTILPSLHHSIIPILRVGAEEGTRTPTGVTLLDPESSASTNSATSACFLKSIENHNLLFYIFVYKVNPFFFLRPEVRSLLRGNPEYA